ncbi:hypothetical protein Tco_0946393 [Tanacetum coccineum]
MAYFVSILTSDSTRSFVMHCTLPTKGMRSVISMVSISLEGFLPSILLLVMIIVAVVIVAVILVVVVVTIVGVVIVVMIIGVFVIVTIIRVVVVVVVGWAYAFHQDKASSVRWLPEQMSLVFLGTIAMTTNRISPNLDISCQNLVDLTGDEDPTDEDGDIGVSVSLGDEIFSEGKESRESNIGDSDNTGDGGKTAGRAIIT